jgi:hypothetical protein
MAGKINGTTTSNIRIDICVDDNPNFGAKSGAEVATILRKLAEKFEAGHLPMNFNEHAVEGASVDYH